MQIFYGVMAIAGLCATGYFNLQFMQLHGSDMLEFIKGGYANPSAASLSSDVIVAAIAGFTWMLHEAKRLQMKNRWLYVIVGCAVAFAFAYPLFLLMRERKIQQNKLANNASATH